MVTVQTQFIFKNCFEPVGTFSQTWVTNSDFSNNFNAFVLIIFLNCYMNNLKGYPSFKECKQYSDILFQPITEKFPCYLVRSCHVL